MAITFELTGMPFRTVVLMLPVPSVTPMNPDEETGWFSSAVSSRAFTGSLPPEISNFRIEVSRLSVKTSSSDAGSAVRGSVVISGS